MKIPQITLADDHWCFACGSDNPHGLHLSDFHFEGADYVCTFTPQRHHQGWAGLTHGGIIATLLDEIMSRMLREQHREAVTAEITIRYRKPVTTGQSLTVQGRITRKRVRFVEAEAEVLFADGTLAAQARAKFVVS